VSPAELQRRIAVAFDAQGWSYDLSVGPQLVDAVRSQGRADPAELVSTLPNAFFQRNRVSKEVVEAVIGRAIGGGVLTEEAAMPATIVIGGNNYQLNVGEGAAITNSNVNLGDGTQVVVDSGASKEDVLVAIEAIVRAGLRGDWSDDAAKDLARLVDDRADLDYEDVQRVALAVVKSEQPAKERLKGFLARIAASGLSGALATGITAGVGEAIAHIPW
jgi:hypothetical protein